MKKVLLLGYGPSALTALESLVKQFSVVAVVRQRQKGSFEDPVERYAYERNIPIVSDPSVSSVERAVIELQPDCVVASSYDQILGKRILDRSKFVNVHYSHLPRYRGLSAVNWVVANSEHETAITIHSMTPDLDAGNILYQQVVPVGPDQTAWELLTVLNNIQLEVLGNTVSRHLEGYTGSPQDGLASTFSCARVPEDGEIDWAASTEKIYALIRALSPPWPGAHTYLGTRRVTIVRAFPVTRAERYEGRIPGRVIGRSRADGFVDVLTGDGILRIHEVTREEGGVIPASAEITSIRQTLGLRVADLLIRMKELERRLNEGQCGNAAGPSLLGALSRACHCSSLKYSRAGGSDMGVAVEEVAVPAVRNYDPEHACSWNDLVARACNGTFMHTRRFISYHGDRFSDRSLLLENRRGSIVGVFPAAEDPADPEMIISHPGLSYGGLVHDGSVRGASMIGALEAIASHYRSIGYQRLRYKVVPYIYHTVPADDDKYALFRLGARCSRADLSATVDVTSRGRVTQRRLRSRKRALSEGVSIEENWDEISGFWCILEQNLARRHGSSPVHSLAEIQMLHDMFPDAILLITAKIGPDLVGGTVLFSSERVLRMQYTATTAQGRAAFATDLVMEKGIDIAIKRGCRYFDFGICTVDSGRSLNQDLYHFKVSFGGGGVVYDHYELDLW